VEILDARAALRLAAHHGHDETVEIRAPMPGKIVKVLAEEGGSVESNQGIVVMEAMKMQNEIKTPRKGVIRRLMVAEGTAVNGGDLIATLE
jgi:biotin carboxyl carrier protein